MKLTPENIKHIDNTLIKDRINYIDLRIEIIDHISSELEILEGDFEVVFPKFYEEKKSFIRQMFVSHMKLDYKKGYKQLLNKLFSLSFFFLFLMINAIIIFLNHTKNKEFVLEYLDIIPIILPTPITIIMLYNFLLSKNNSTDLTSLVGITNLIIVSYVFGGIYIIREIDTLLWIPIFSFYLTINLSYYFFYFSSKKRHEKKYNSILYNR
jgi:hypothetical protein